MSKVIITLNSKLRRQQAAKWCLNADDGVRVTFAEPKRTGDQSERMYAMLTDVAKQTTHHGVKLSKDDWKLLFLDALKREMRLVPNLEGTGIVPLSGRSSSELSVREMSDMIELIFAHGIAWGVKFRDDQGGAGANNSRAEVVA